jgi:hypothetical protein
MFYKNVNEDLKYIFEKLKVDKKDYKYKFVLKECINEPSKSHIRYDRWFIHIKEKAIIISDGTIKNELFVSLDYNTLSIVLKSLI